MSGLGNNTNIEQTFDEIYQKYEPGLFTKGEHLRGKEDGTLYLHGMFSISNKGEEALKERQGKWEQGSKTVRQTIDRDYGDGVGAKIFQKISDRVDRDLSKELLRGDLPLIKSELQRLEKTPFKPELDGNQRLQSKVYGGEKGTVTRSEKMDGILTEMFKRPLTDDDIRGIAGVPDGCSLKLNLIELDPRIHLNVGHGSYGVFIALDGPDPSGAFKSIQVTAYLDKEGKLNIYQDSMSCNEELKGGRPRPTHLGACAIVRMVDTARMLRVNTIHNFSSQGPGYNGYYTWARCGGDAPIHTVEVRSEDRGRYRDFMKELGRSTNPTIRELSGKEDLRVQDFMQTEVGRTFWRDHGFAIPLQFDLNDGSPTMQTMHDYTLPNSCFELRD